MWWTEKIHSSIYTDDSYTLFALTMSLASIIGFKSIVLLDCKTIPSIICKRGCRITLGHAAAGEHLRKGTVGKTNAIQQSYIPSIKTSSH